MNNKLINKFNKLCFFFNYLNNKIFFVSFVSFCETVKVITIYLNQSYTSCALSLLSNNLNQQYNINKTLNVLRKIN